MEFSDEQRIADLEAANRELRRNVAELHDYIGTVTASCATVPSRTVTINNTLGNTICDMCVPIFQNSNLLCQWIANRLCLDTSLLVLRMFPSDSWAQDVLDATQITLAVDAGKEDFLNPSFASPPTLLRSTLNFLQFSNIVACIGDFLDINDVFSLAATCQQLYCSVLLRGGNGTWQHRQRSMCPSKQCFALRPVLAMDRCVTLKDFLHTLESPQLHPHDVISMSVQAERYSKVVADQIMFPHPRTEASELSQLEFDSIHCGLWLDVLDTVQKWYDATVIEVDRSQRTFKVHYNNWSNNWDETISYDSSNYRLERRGSKFDREADTLRSAVKYFVLSASSKISREHLTELLKQTFHDVDELQTALHDNLPTTITNPGWAEILSMVETCYVRSSYLRDFSQRESARFFLEYQYSGKVCAFFIIIDPMGQGIVYTRYGSHRWKH